MSELTKWREWIVTNSEIGCDGASLNYPELIRCKDCAKRSFTKCPMAIGRQSDYDYCSRAERKEE